MSYKTSLRSAEASKEDKYLKQFAGVSEPLAWLLGATAAGPKRVKQLCQGQGWAAARRCWLAAPVAASRR